MELVTSSAFLAVLGTYLIIVALALWLVSPRLERFLGAERFRLEQAPEGAPRSIFIVLFLIAAWACLVFVIPIALSVQSQLSQAQTSGFVARDLWKIFLPLGLFFLLLVYGASHQLLCWIADQEWPQQTSDRKSDHES